MCLLVFGYRYRADTPLFLLANRDEFYDRPTQALQRWDEVPLIAGRDLRSGGSWLAFGPGGRWAALTNARDRLQAPVGAPSRGQLVTDFCLSPSSPMQWAQALNTKPYAGFNLLVGNSEELVYVTDQLPARSLPPGLYGLSNAELDTDWPKLVQARERVRGAWDVDFSPTDWLNTLATPGPGPGLESIFVTTAEYGTRSTTLAWVKEGTLEVWERSYPSAQIACVRVPEWIR